MLYQCDKCQTKFSANEVDDDFDGEILCDCCWENEIVSTPRPQDPDY